MKIQAYKCDCCGHGTSEEDIHGFKPVSNLFSNSFVSCPPEDTNTHICSGCYNEYVLIPVDKRMGKSKDADLKKELISEYSYLLRKKVFDSVLKKK